MAYKEAARDIQRDENMSTNSSLIGNHNTSLPVSKPDPLINNTLLLASFLEWPLIMPLLKVLLLQPLSTIRQRLLLHSDPHQFQWTSDAHDNLALPISQK